MYNNTILIQDETKKTLAESIKAFSNESLHNSVDSLISREKKRNLIEFFESYDSTKHISLSDMRIFRQQLANLLPITEVHILRTVNSHLIKDKTTFNRTRRAYSAESYLHETRLSMGENSENPAIKLICRNSSTSPIIANNAIAVNPMTDFYSDTDDTYYQCVAIDQLTLFLRLYNEETCNDIAALVDTVHKFSAYFINHLIGILPEEMSVENFTATIPNAVYIAKRLGNHAYSANYLNSAERCTLTETITDLGVDRLRKFMHDSVYGCFVCTENLVIGRYWISDKYNATDDVPTFSFKEDSIDTIISASENQL